jgi:hypothetical protein
MLSFCGALGVSAMMKRKTATIDYIVMSIIFANVLYGSI